MQKEKHIAGKKNHPRLKRILDEKARIIAAYYQKELSSVSKDDSLCSSSS